MRACTHTPRERASERGEREREREREGGRERSRERERARASCLKCVLLITLLAPGKHTPTDPASSAPDTRCRRALPKPCNACVPCSWARGCAVPGGRAPPLGRRHARARVERSRVACAGVYAVPARAGWGRVHVGAASQHRDRSWSRLELAAAWQDHPAGHKLP